MILLAVCCKRSKLIGTIGKRSRAAEPIVQSLDFVVRLGYSVETGKFFPVVLVAGAYDIKGLLPAIDLSDLSGRRGCARRALVRQEVVLEPVHNRPGNIFDISA